MAKNKGKGRNLYASDFIITPRQRMQAKLDAANQAMIVASAAANQDTKDFGGSFMDRWENVYDKLTS